MTGTSSPDVALRDVSVGYDGTPVLDDITWDVPAGIFAGLVGPSGAGKTTLLRTLLGQLRPMHGHVTVRSGLRIAYVPQLETVNWNFPVTVFDCVLMARPQERWPWASAQERADVMQVLERLGIAELANRQIRALSGGQQQRMFLARALLRQPQLLLLDEPTSGVDVTTRHDVLHLLADLHAQGIGIILTTHDLNGMAAHLPHLVCVNGGIIAAGQPADVLTPPVLEQTFGARMEVLQHLGMPIVVEGTRDVAHPQPGGPTS
ncbi:MAG: metal ABC transporter ATP-binding protein [Actinobacteria bacterium]|nr:metal ABC transporter ATP-binding protein [Actinomycetota bacterium]